jgi:hypothetical protein
MRRLFVLAALLALAGCVPAQERLEVRERPLAGGTDLTFFVTGDSHFGAPFMVEANTRLIEQMNSLPGTVYPAAIGGTVGVPRGVLHVGDITDFGTPWDWQDFVRLYGLTGKDGLLKYPIYEATGNHDRLLLFNTFITSAVAARHGGLPYSWDWGDVHFACLDEYPTHEITRWLSRDLASVGHAAPIIIFFHRTLDGFLAEDWSLAEKEDFARAIDGYNVVAIFTGHWHLGGHHRWKEYDVFRPSSPRHDDHQFLVVHITDTTLTATLWNWNPKDALFPGERWTGPAFTKPINGAKSAGR